MRALAGTHVRSRVIITAVESAQDGGLTLLEVKEVSTPDPCLGSPPGLTGWFLTSTKEAKLQLQEGAEKSLALAVC